MIGDSVGILMVLAYKRVVYVFSLMREAVNETFCRRRSIEVAARRPSEMDRIAECLNSGGVGMLTEIRSASPPAKTFSIMPRAVKRASLAGWNPLTPN